VIRTKPYDTVRYGGGQRPMLQKIMHNNNQQFLSFLTEHKIIFKFFPYLSVTILLQSGLFLYKVRCKWEFHTRQLGEQKAL
jgi:hypothetical protein